jgi:hypothetical protein
MLQSIAENNKKNDFINKKSTKTDLNKAKDVPGKKSSENQDKRDSSKKTVGNLDKIVSGTTIKKSTEFCCFYMKKGVSFFINFRNFQ